MLHYEEGGKPINEVVSSPVDIPVTIRWGNDKKVIGSAQHLGDGVYLAKLDNTAIPGLFPKLSVTSLSVNSEAGVKELHEKKVN